MDNSLQLTQQSYQEIKEHFMIRFQQIDRELIDVASSSDPFERQDITQQKVVAFVQEGIGALLAYLPPKTSVNTLKDFIEIIDPNLQVVPKHQSKILQQVYEEESKRKPAPMPSQREVIVEPVHIRPQPIKRVAPKKVQSMPVAAPQRPSEQALITNTVTIALDEMKGQVDFLASINDQTFIVGSTVGMVAVYNSTSHHVIKVLINEGLSVYEIATHAHSKRISLACDGGLVMIYETEQFEKIGQITVQQPDITALIYTRGDVLVVGQVLGYIDVITFSHNKATVTHSLQIKEAGDINTMAYAASTNQFMIACQKGLLMCEITPKNTFNILRSEDEYSSLYVVNICWCGDDKYVVITSRPRFANKKQIPPNEENYAVISFTLYTTNEPDNNERQVILGQYRTTFSQATFPVTKVQVIMPKRGMVTDQPDESPYKGRFLLAMLDQHLKIIDVEQLRLFDLLTEPNFDHEAVSGMGLSRSIIDRHSRLLILCHGPKNLNGEKGGSFIQRIDFNTSLPNSLGDRVELQRNSGKLQKNQLGPDDL